MSKLRLVQIPDPRGPWYRTELRYGLMWLYVDGSGSYCYETAKFRFENVKMTGAKRVVLETWP